MPHLHDFPNKFGSYEALAKLLTHLIFQTTVKHHAMNGAPTLQTAALPYSTPALWKPFPTAKLKAGKTLDPLSFSIPKNLAPRLIGLVAAFNCPMPDSESLFSAYTSAPLATESVLSYAINDYVSTLKDIGSFIAESEGGETWPYRILRPRKLPYYEWI